MRKTIDGQRRDRTRTSQRVRRALLQKIILPDYRSLRPRRRDVAVGVVPSTALPLHTLRTVLRRACALLRMTSLRGETTEMRAVRMVLEEAKTFHRGHGGTQSKKARARGSGPLKFYSSDRLQRAHVGEEFAVSAGLAELVDQQFHCFNGRKRVENFPQYPNAREVFLGNQEFFFTRA